MSGLAVAARGLGYQVSGTDPGAYPPTTDWLDEHAITWWREPDATHVEGVDTLVISGGTPSDDVELRAAQKQGIAVLSYAQFVGELVVDKRRIVVAGTHGKTTTTALIAWLLESAAKPPDYVIGIQPKNFDSSVRLSESKVIILEGDEYKASSIDERSKFWYYRPDVLVVTSLEMDHPDLFKSVSEIEVRFREVVEAMPPDAKFLYAAGVAELKTVADASKCENESYGIAGDWFADHVLFKPEGLAFDLYNDDVYHGHFTVPLYGSHNVANSIAAIVVARGEGLDRHDIQHALETFQGAARRFSILSAPEARITVIDDYAHHPTEIGATINAAKLHFGRRVIAVVRPHTYSRTRELLEEYRTAVRLADICFVTEIEGAREATLTTTVRGHDIVKDNSEQVVFEPDRAKLVERIEAAAQPGDVVICMTVSGYEGLADELGRKLT